MQLATPPPRLGLRENLGQFSLLVLVNAFVGAMVGLERSILPAIADLERAVRAAGLSLRNGETPRELLLRAEAAGIATAPLAGLRQAARRHERLRYGPAATRPDRGTPRT